MAVRFLSNETIDGNATFAGSVTANTGSKITSSSTDTTFSIETTSGTTIFPVLDFVSSHSSAGARIRVSGTDVISIDKSQNATFAGNVTLSSGFVNLPAGAVGTPSLIFGGDDDTGLWHPASNTLAFSTFGSERMRIDSSGNVGIGDSTPSYKLDVNGDIQVNETIFARSGSDLILQARSSQVVGINSGGSRTMTLDASQRVGIGTTSPSTKLHISGGDPSIRLTPSGSNDARVDFTDSGGTVRWYTGYDVSSGNLVIAADESGFGSDNIMVMSDAGNVIVGGTAFDAAGSVSFKSNGIIRGVLSSGTADSTIINAIYGVSNGFQLSNDASNNQEYIFHNGGSVSLKINSSGNVGIGTTSIGTQSNLYLGASSSSEGGQITLQKATGGTLAAHIDAYTSGGTDFMRVLSGTDTATTAAPFVFNLTSTRLGIGTSSPSRELDIQASSGWAEIALRGQTGAGGSLEFYTTTTKRAEIFADTEDIVFRNTSTNQERMRIDSSGTTSIVKTSAGSSTTPLVVRNSGSANVGTEARLFLSTVANDDRGAYISSIITSSSNDNALILATNSAGSSPTERMRIRSGGEVIVGNSTINGSFGASNSILAIKGSSSGGEGILQITGLGNNATDIVSRIEFHSQAEADPMCSIRAVRGSADDIGSLTFLTNNGGNPDTKLIIDSAGDSFFKGNITIDGFAGGKYLSLRDATCCNNPSGSGGVGLKAIDHSGAANDGLGIYGHDGVSIYTIQTKRMQVDSAGFSRFTTSGSFSYGPGYNFHEFVNNYGGEPTLMVANTATGNPNNYGINVIHDSTAANTTGRFFLGQTASTERIKIFSNGNIQNSNNSYGQLSDETIKENIVDATPKLNEINQVRVVNFNYIGDTQKQIGVVAQELEQIFPGLVYEVGNTEIDENGKEVPTGETTKAVKYSVFVPMLIKSIQELKAEIDTLKSQIQ